MRCLNGSDRGEFLRGNTAPAGSLHDIRHCVRYLELSWLGSKQSVQPEELFEIESLQMLGSLGLSRLVLLTN